MKQERQTTLHKNDEQNNVALRQRNHKRKRNKCENLLIQKKEKRKKS